MSVLVTGDIHGNPQRFSSDVFPEQKEMSKDDYVIILGDFGLVWDYRGESKEEKYWLDWLENKPFTTLFIDGNHENYDRLGAYPIEEWNGGNIQRIRSSIIHLMRGQIYTIENRTFFTFGGASSHDISAGILDPYASDFKKKKKHLDKDPLALYRINHISWWERELPNNEEMEIGLENLQKKNNKVDYILTHSPCDSLLRQMDGGSHIYKSDYFTNYLQRIKDTVNYKFWLFGHMHQNRNFYWENSLCIYEQIVRIL